MNKDRITLQKQCILGVNTAIKGGVHLLDEEQILYSSGNHVLIWNKHRRNQTFIHQCGNGEEIQLVTLCSARKLIAIAVKSIQVGHHLIIYDAISFKRKKVIKIQNDDDRSDVISLSFSKDGKQCLVLRDAPFYFLTLWNIEKSAKVSASIRLATPSGKQMRTAELRPSSDSSKEIVVCASGRGIIRFFKIEDGIFRPITVNLRREQQNYIVQRWLSSDVVVLGTDNNELIVIENFDMKYALPMEAWKDCLITSMTVFSQGIIIGSDHGTLHIYNCTKESQYLPSLAKIVSKCNDATAKILSIDKVPTEEFFISLTVSGKVWSYPLCDNDHATCESMLPCFHASGSNGNSSITCMDICVFKPIIATGGSDKTVRIWNYVTNTFELTCEFDTDIISLSLHPNSLQLLVCCKNHIELNYIYGNKLDPVWRRERQQIIFCKFSNGGQYFALVCGPYVQIFDSYTFSPMNTLRGHSAHIETLAWRQDDQEIATIGLDAVVCKWNVSNGKRMLRYVNEETSRSFHGGCFDENLEVALVNAGETHEVGKLQMITSEFEYDKSLPLDSNFKSICNGVAVTIPKDDSLIGTVMVGTYENNVCGFQKKKFHSKTISCVVISSSHLFTASEDGTLCICTIINLNDYNQMLEQESHSNLSSQTSSFEDILLPAETIDAIDSKVKYLRLEIEKLREAQRIELEDLTNQHNENTLRLQSQIEDLSKKQIQTNIDNKMQAASLKSRLQEDMDSKKRKLEEEIQTLELFKKKELETELDRFQQNKRSQEEKMALLKSELKSLEDDFVHQKKHLISEMHQKTQLEIEKYQILSSEKDNILSKYNETVRMLEEDADLELADEIKTYELQSIHEQKATLRLQEENDISMKRYNALMKDYEEHKETIISLQEKQQALESTINDLQKRKLDLEHDIKGVEKEINYLDVEINDATEETNRMERTKVSQSKYINDLKVKLQPQEEDFQRLSDLSENLDVALKKAALQNDNFRVQVEATEKKLCMVTKEVLRKSKQVANKEKEVHHLEREFKEVINSSSDFDEVKRRLIALSKEQTSINGNNEHHVVDQREMKTRMADILRREIASKRDILDRHKKLHQTRIQKLKNDRFILEKQMKEVQEDSIAVVQKQADVLN